VASLADDSDLEARLGRDLTTAEAARSTALLADASALIRRYTKRRFEAVANAEVELRPVGSLLRLPGRPVTAVDQVEQIGTAGSADRVMGVSEWAWDGIDLIELWPCPVALLGVLPTSTYADTYRVTYDYGSATVPDDVVAVCCRMVLAILTAPTMAQGLVQERIGQYSYQFGQAPGQASPGATVRMTDVDRDDLRHYRRTAGTIALKVR